MHNWKKSRIKLPLLAMLAALFGCEPQDPRAVGSNAEPLTVDKVDILLVVDDSASMADFKQEELPRLVQAFVAGFDPEIGPLPDIENVHVAVTSTDLGNPNPGGEIHGCDGVGNDGRFIPLSDEDLARCETEFPSFVSLDQGSAPLVTTATIACLPALDPGGCGFEQPLEASLKALWPASDTSIEFLQGSSHGTGANAGFLREDSLLIVVVISDEDDCSVEDARVYLAEPQLAPEDPLAHQGLNVRCALNPDKLFATERYLNALNRLRPNNDNVLFVALGGIPPELVDEEAQAEVDFDQAAERDAFFDGILAAPEMQERLADPEAPPGAEYLAPSCMKPNGYTARPPRRLVQLAKDFGERGVVGSLCDDDFGPVVGRIIRAAAERID